MNKRKWLLLCIWLIVLFSVPAMAESLPSDTQQTLLQTIWKAQTMEGLNNGIWVIPEEAINEYYASCSDDEKVKNPTLQLLGDDKIYVAFDSSVGRVGLTCQIMKFVHNENESYAEIDVRKKEIIGKPFLSWMLKFVSLGAIGDLYGNPLKDVKQVEAKLSGNTLKVNFRPMMEKLVNNDIGKLVAISSIKVRQGALELHTNMKASDVLALMK